VEAVPDESLTVSPHPYTRRFMIIELQTYKDAMTSLALQPDLVIGEAA
jgi:hypothetical protein